MKLIKYLIVVAYVGFFVWVCRTANETSGALETFVTENNILAIFIFSIPIILFFFYNVYSIFNRRKIRKEEKLIRKDQVKEIKNDKRR